MARDFSKDVANYYGLGIDRMGNILEGAAFVSIHAIVAYDTLDTAANNNPILQWKIGSNLTSFLLSIHDGTSAVLRAGARSQNADAFQARNGTTVLSAGTFYGVGAVFDYAGDTITPYLDGVAEGGGAVTFGATSYTHTAGTSHDGIGANLGTTGTPTSTAAQFDGRIAELGAWAGSRALTSDEMLSLGAYRVNPRQVAPNLLKAYMPLNRATDLVNGLIHTITGSIPVADHPRVVRAATMRADNFMGPAVAGAAKIATLHLGFNAA